MREDISDPSNLAAKADKIGQSSSTRSVNTLYPPLLRLLLVVMIVSTLSANFLCLTLLSVFLLVLFQVLHTLCPPVQPQISACIIANTVIRLNIAEL